MARLNSTFEESLQKMGESLKRTEAMMRQCFFKVFGQDWDEVKALELQSKSNMESDADVASVTMAKEKNQQLYSMISSASEEVAITAEFDMQPDDVWMQISAENHKKKDQQCSVIFSTSAPIACSVIEESDAELKSEFTTNIGAVMEIQIQEIDAATKFAIFQEDENEVRKSESLSSVHHHSFPSIPKEFSKGSIPNSILQQSSVPASVLQQETKVMEDETSYTKSTLSNKFSSGCIDTSYKGARKDINFDASIFFIPFDPGGNTFQNDAHCYTLMKKLHCAKLEELKKQGNPIEELVEADIKVTIAQVECDFKETSVICKSGILKLAKKPLRSMNFPFDPGGDRWSGLLGMIHDAILDFQSG